MIQHLIFASIFSFIVNILLFSLITINYKIIISLLITSLIFYIVINNKEKLEDYQDKFIIILLMLTIIFWIYKFIEHIIIYGPNHTSSISLILFAFLGFIILLNIYLFFNGITINI